jgi:hypothetical protein
MQAQNIVALIKGLTDKKIDPKSLSIRLKKKVVTYLVREQSEISLMKIATLIGTSESQASRYKRMVFDDMSWEVKEQDVLKLAAGLKLKKEELQRKALTRTRTFYVRMPVGDGERTAMTAQVYPDPDLRLAWDIETEYIEKMVEMGFIARQPDRLVVEDAFSAQLEATFREHGIPTVEEFMRRYRVALDSSGGNGGKSGGGNNRGKPLALIGPGGQGEGEKGRP